MIYMENSQKHRYYLLYATQDLLESWCLVTSFGSTITHHGRTITKVHPSKESALLALFDIETKKRQRGYTYSDLIHPDLFHLRPQTIKEVLSRKPTTNTTLDNHLTALIDFEVHNLTCHPNQQELFA